MISGARVGAVLRSSRRAGAFLAVVAVLVAHAAPGRAQTASSPPGGRAPQVVVISLDGAKPDVLERLFASGALDRNVGLGRLAQHGVVARQNVTATPSVTAVAHTSIATG